MSETTTMASEETTMSNKNLKNLMQEVREMYKTMVKETEYSLEFSYGLKRTFLEESIIFTLEELKSYSDEQIVELYEKYYDPNATAVEKRTEVADMREDLEQAKRMSNSVFQTKQEYEDIEKTYSDMLDDQWTARNSKENREHMLEDLKLLKEKAENVEDEIEKKKILHKIEVMEASISLDFVLTRIRTVTKAEHDRVMEYFFHEKSGSYTMERCKTRIKKFGYEPDWYKFFFNLEEKFLPETYHPFNNLFLFGMMRFISYSDPYNKEDQVYVRALLNSLTGLIYHKFDSEVEERIISVIQAYDDFYQDDRAYFEENNTTHPNHPVRIQYSQKNEADRKEALVKAMTAVKIPVPEESMTADDMQKYYNEKMEELIRNNTSNEETHGDAEVTENEDGSISIVPSFNKDKYRNPVDCIDGKFYYYGPGVTKDTDLDTYEGDSFFTVFQLLKKRGIQNNKEMLELHNPDVPTAWEQLSDLQPEEIDAIRKEASENIWYYLRFCTNGIFTLTAASMALVHALIHKVNTWACTPRQTGISYAYYYAMSWFLLYDSHVENISFVGRDMEESHHIRSTVLKNILEEGISEVIMNDPSVVYNISKKKLWVDTIDTLDAENTADLYYFGDFEFIPGMDDLVKDTDHFVWRHWAVLDSSPNDAYKVPEINRLLRDESRCTHWDDAMYDDTKLDFDTMRNKGQFLYVEKPVGEDLLPFTDTTYEDRMHTLIADPSEYQREILLKRETTPTTDTDVPEAVELFTKKIEEEGLRSVDEFLHSSSATEE